MPEPIALSSGRWLRSTFAFLAVAACGGRANGTNNASAGSGSGSGTVSVAPSSMSGGASSGVVGPAGAGATIASGAATGSALAIGEASSSDGGVTGGSVASGPVDAGNVESGSAARPGVACGTTTCRPPEDVCCFDGTVDGASVTIVQTCHDVCPKDTGGFACTGPKNCPEGQICCAPTGVTLNAQCTVGACAGWQFCQSNDDCEGGETCFAFPPTGIPNVSITTGVCGPVDASLMGD